MSNLREGLLVFNIDVNTMQEGLRFLHAQMSNLREGLLVFNIDVSKPQPPIESLSQSVRGVALFEHDLNFSNEFALAFHGLSLISIDFHHRIPTDLFIDFHQFSLVALVSDWFPIGFIGFHQFSLVSDCFIDFH